MTRLKEFIRYVVALSAGRQPKLPARTDAEAIAGDWEAVGRDMRKALDALAQQAVDEYNARRTRDLRDLEKELDFK